MQNLRPGHDAEKHEKYDTGEPQFPRQELRGHTKEYGDSYGL
jgi:hypothetical protein